MMSHADFVHGTQAQNRPPCSDNDSHILREARRQEEEGRRHGRRSNSFSRVIHNLGNVFHHPDEASTPATISPPAAALKPALKPRKMSLRTAISLEDLSRNPSPAYLATLLFSGGNPTTSSTSKPINISRYSREPLRSPMCSASVDNKKVHFADADGRNLVQLQQYNKACTDGSQPMALGTKDSAAAAMSHKVLVPKFRQPESLPDFLKLVMSRGVHLENAYADADHHGVKGIVRVLNMTYHKEVYIRWSLDKWESMCDYRIAYVDSSYDTATDRYMFDICAPMNVGDKLEFSVRYECMDQAFWDDNDGQNYSFVCEIKHRGNTNRNSPYRERPFHPSKHSGKDSYMEGPPLHGGSLV